jgi:hypothetical protein
MVKTDERLISRIRSGGEVRLRSFYLSEVAASTGVPGGVVRLTSFLPFRQSHCKGRRLWCPPPAPAAPLTYHRLGPLTMRNSALLLPSLKGIYVRISDE